MPEEKENPFTEVARNVQYLNDSYRGIDPYGHLAIKFQDGPLTEEGGQNGCFIEDVLEVAKHRISIQNEKVPCKENEHAMKAIDDALAFLDDRTARIAAEKEKEAAGEEVVETPAENTEEPAPEENPTPDVSGDDIP